MEYHQQLNTYHNQQYSAPPPGQSNIGGLPDSQQASSNEKALMWSAGTYIESGYSTQAPSISSIDAFLNNEQIDSAMQNIETASTVSSTVNTAVTTTTTTAAPKAVEQPPQYAQLQSPTTVANPAPVQAKQQQQPQHHQDELLAPSEEDAAVADWMSTQQNSDQAIQAIPEMLKLLLDDDLFVVHEAALYLKHMTISERTRDILIQTPNFVEYIVKCLFRINEMETAKLLIGALYGISQNKTLGTKALLNSTALIPLIKMLEFPNEIIANYAIVALHNVLSSDSESKVQLTKMGAVQSIVPLLKINTSLKFLSIVVDSLYYLALSNQEAKNIIFEMRGAEMLIMVLINHSTAYKKLFYNTVRLMKVLSIDAQCKQLFVQHNVIPTLAMHLNTIKPESNGGMHDLLNNILITIRNLSDAAIKLNGQESLIVNLIQLLNTKSSPKDTIIINLVADILSNMTCNNEYKKVVARSNGVHVLLRIIHQNLTQNLNVKVLEPILCVMKHITNRHPDMLLCQEQIRNMGGLQLVTDLMTVQPRSWTCIKPLLGLVRHLCLNQLNLTQMRELSIIPKLMQIMFDAYTEINMRTNNGTGSLVTNKQGQIVVKVEEDVNLCDIIDLCSMILLILAKDYQDQMVMKQLDCITFFIQMFFSPIVNNQKAASSILAELAINKECAMLMDQAGSLHQFIQMNFCNQFGMLKSIAELNSNNSNASIVLKNVHTLMQRLQEHRQAAAVQQQQPQMMHQHQQQMPRNNSYPGQYPPQQQQMDAYRQQQAYYQQQQQQYPGAGFPPNQQFY